MRGVHRNHLEALPEWFTEVFSDLVHSNATHCSYGEGSNQGVWVLTVLMGKWKTGHEMEDTQKR